MIPDTVSVLLGESYGQGDVPFVETLRHSSARGGGEVAARVQNYLTPVLVQCHDCGGVQSANLDTEDGEDARLRVVLGNLACLCHGIFLFFADGFGFILQ